MVGVKGRSGRKVNPSTWHSDNRHRERSRHFSIVVHDVVTEIGKSDLSEYLLSLRPYKYQVAEENYNHQEGHHLHAFIWVPNAISKIKLLKNLQSLFTGRVQVDVGRGSYEACVKYLTDPLKNKHVDENVQIVEKPEYYVSHENTCPSVCGRCVYLNWLKSKTPDFRLTYHETRRAVDYVPPPYVSVDGHLKYNIT